jgi:hypothetical protein
MSTKSTIKYIPNKLHLYRECFSNEVYLELENAEFECHADGIGNNITISLDKEVINSIYDYKLNEILEENGQFDMTDVEDKDIEERYYNPNNLFHDLKGD